MREMKRKYVNRYINNTGFRLGFAMVLVIIILLSLSVITSCTAKEPTPLENPREECQRVGGTWTTFSNACADSCAYARGKVDVCAQVLIEGCDCGLDRCWNGETCEPI